MTKDQARIELARLVEKHGLAVDIAQTATIYRNTRGSCAVPGIEAATDLQLLLTWLRAIGREPLT